MTKREKCTKYEYFFKPLLARLEKAQIYLFNVFLFYLFLFFYHNSPVKGNLHAEPSEPPSDAVLLCRQKT